MGIRAVIISEPVIDGFNPPKWFTDKYHKILRVENNIISSIHDEKLTQTLGDVFKDFQKAINETDSTLGTRFVIIEEDYPIRQVIVTRTTIQERTCTALEIDEDEQEYWGVYE